MAESKSKREFAFAPEEFEKLVAAARDGSSEALQSISQGCRDYLLLIANQELDENLRQKLGPSDIVQNSLIAVNQNLKQFRGENMGQFLCWARTILLNDLRRARRDFTQIEKRNIGREESVSGNSAAGVPAMQLHARQATPGTRAVASEESRLLELAISRLPALQQQVIQLRNWEQKSFEEIGAVTNRTPGAAQKIWQRAVVKLKEELKSLEVL